MGFIRKTISGSLAMFTGGASLGVVQFRSDTERGTRETKKLRKELGHQTSSPTGGHEVVQSNVSSSPSVIQGVSSLEIESSNAFEPPSELSAGWKSSPSSPDLEQFWNGHSWTALTRVKK
jgi:hypothetical protein